MQWINIMKMNNEMLDPEGNMCQSRMQKIVIQKNVRF